MAESSTNSEKNFFHTRSTLSNEHLLFAETLRDWSDPLLHGHQPLPVLLCPRCSTCKCESLKELHHASSHSHDPTCPNFHHSYDQTRTPYTQRIMTKSKRRANSHDPSISMLNTSSSSSSINTSKSAEHPIKQKKSTSKIPVRISDYSPSSSSINLNRSLNKNTKIPEFILTHSLPSPIDDSYETDSLNEDVYQTPMTMSDDLSKNQQSNQMKRKKSTSKSRRYRYNEGRSSKSKATSNDLSSSSSSSSSSSLSIVPVRKKTHSQRLSSPPQVPSSLSDDSLSEQHQSRPRSTYMSTKYVSPPTSVYLLRLPNQITPTPSFGLTKSSTYTWKNEDEDNDYYPHYSIEQVLPNLDDQKRSIPILSRHITLQRGQTDYWENCEISPDTIITSSCENSTGSASHLLSSSPDFKQSKNRRNSHGHIISITTTKRQQPSLLNKSKKTRWNIESDGKQLRYSKVNWHSDEQLQKHTHSGPKRLSDSQTDTGSSNEQKNRSKPVNEIHKETIPVDTKSNPPVLTQSIVDFQSKTISYASTDEDVDELNSNYSDVLDRSNLTIQNSCEKSNLHLLNEQTESNRNSISCSKILSTEYSQITLDSGVDIISEEKLYQPNRTLTIDEQSSEETTDQNDLFALSDDSSMDMQSNNHFHFNPNDLSNSMNYYTDQETYFSAKSELTTDKDQYSGYELVTISDEDDDHHHHEPMKDDSNEFIITTELSPPLPPASSSSSSFSIPSQFEFKLPSFGEWIDRVFTTFLTETNQNQPLSVSSSRSSSIVSIHGSQSTINTSSSSQVITVLENENYQNLSERARKEEQDDDEHSLNDMSSSSLNCDEKVDFDTYIINSNYEKINPSITNEQNEILFINERSKSLLSSITSSIENDDQEVMNNERRMLNDNDDNISKQIEFQYPSNSHDSLLQTHLNTTTTSSTDDLTRTNQFLSSTFHSKDSALGLSDDHLNKIQSNELIIQEHISLEDKIIDSSEIPINTNTYISDDTRKKPTIMNEHDQSIARTISSSSSEQLIPKEKQTGMYYKAFGSSAAIHLAEQYRCEWLQDVSQTIPIEKSSENDDNHLRIVHQYESLGDNEDEFYFSPQILHSSYSCPNLNSNPTDFFIDQHSSYSLTTLDAYNHLNITHETLEQIWLSLLDVAFSDKDDYELGEYKLRHIIGLSNSYSNINQTLIEKSRSHNDIFSFIHKNNSKTITKTKSKSFDITSLIKQSSFMTNDSINLGLLQGADISEPFADRLISTSIHSDLESIQSFEPEQIPNETPSPPPPIVKEPLEYVFNFFPESNPDEFEFDSDDKPLDIPLTFDIEGLPPPILPIQDTYMELSLFRPHSLSTIPSSRASQYASSVDSDDIFEREHQSIKENYPYHISDDDHGVIGSDFSSPQSRPLSSIQSRPLSPEQNQVQHSIKSANFSEIDHEAWERAIDEPIINNDEEEIILNDEYSNHLTSIIPIESNDLQETYLIDQIEPILLSNKNPQENFIEQIDENLNHSTIEQDYITIETHIEPYFDPAELSHRLEQLDLSTKEETIHLSKFIPQPFRHPSLRYPTQRIDKVSDLEIVKQGKGFKIGYADRQGTEQRIILTKRIEAGPDIMERDPQIRVPYKGRRILNQIFSSVLYTNGYNTLEEDKKFEHSANEMEVPMIGTNPKHFDESDMVSIDIDGPSTMLNSICESIIITQGSVYSKPSSTQQVEQPLETIKKDKIEVIDSWHDRTIITGNSTPWRSPFKPPKTSTSSQTIKQEKSTRDIALSPISLNSEQYSQTMNTSLITVDRSCQYSPPTRHDQGLQCYLENLTTYELPGYLKSSIDNPPIRTLMTLERSADSGILVDDHHRMKSHLALQVDLKSLSSDSEDISDVTTQPLNIFEDDPHLNNSTNEIEQEIIQLRRERAHILDLLSLNWNRSNIWVELTEAKLNYIIGETDSLLRSLSFDPSPVDNEAIKLKMHQYEEDMAELTRQHLAVYRERLEDSKRQLDMKIDQLELKKSSIENQTINHLSTLEDLPRLLNTKRSKSFLSTSAENLTITPLDENIASHPHLLDVSFLTTKHSDQRTNNHEAIHRPMPRYSTKNLSNMEGLSQSQQAIIDETDELVKDSQQLHTESASQFERARESLLSSETSIRLARANMAASRSSERKTYLSNDVTLAELFKYEQSLAKEAAKSNRHIYSTTES